MSPHSSIVWPQFYFDQLTQYAFWQLFERLFLNNASSIILSDIWVVEVVSEWCVCAFKMELGVQFKLTRPLWRILERHFSNNLIYCISSPCINNFDLKNSGKSSTAEREPNSITPSKTGGLCYKRAPWLIELLFLLYWTPPMYNRQ